LIRDFVWVAREIDRFKKLQAEKSVSLNEAVRIKEKQESDDRVKSRKKELAARPEPPGKIYDIALKQADQPGLPPPTLRTNSTASVTNGEPKSAKQAKVDSIPTKDKDDSAKLAKSDDDDEVSDSDIPAVDISLDEAKRILIEYIGLLSNGKGVVQSK